MREMEAALGCNSDELLISFDMAWAGKLSKNKSLDRGLYSVHLGNAMF